MTSGRSGRWSDAPGSLAAATDRTRPPRSTGSTAICSAPASKRETSMRSSTSVRIRPTSVTSSSPARRLSTGRSSRCSRRIEASATRAASGVRSSWATSATKRSVAGLGSLEAVDRVGQGGRHPVEALGPDAELVVRGDRHAGRQVAPLDPLCGATGRLDRRQDTAGDDPRHEQGEQDEDDRPDDERRPQLGERLLERRARRGRSSRPVRRRRRGRRRPGSDDRRA